MKILKMKNPWGGTGKPKIRVITPKDLRTVTVRVGVDSPHTIYAVQSGVRKIRFSKKHLKEVGKQIDDLSERDWVVFPETHRDYMNFMGESYLNLMKNYSKKLGTCVVVSGLEKPQFSSDVKVWPKVGVKTPCKVPANETKQVALYLIEPSEDIHTHYKTMITNQEPGYLPGDVRTVFETKDKKKIVPLIGCEARVLMVNYPNKIPEGDLILVTSKSKQSPNSGRYKKNIITLGRPVVEVQNKTCSKSPDKKYGFGSYYFDGEFFRNILFADKEGVFRFTIS